MSLFADLGTVTQPTQSTSLKRSAKKSIRRRTTLNTSTAKGQCSLTRKSAKQRVYARQLYSHRHTTTAAVTPTLADAVIQQAQALIDASKQYRRQHKYDTRRQRQVSEHAAANQCHHTHLKCTACADLHLQAHSGIHDLCSQCAHTSRNAAQQQYQPYNIITYLLDKQTERLHTVKPHSRIDPYTDTPVLQPAHVTDNILTQVSIPHNKHSAQTAKVEITETDNIAASVRLTDHLNEKYRYNPYKRKAVTDTAAAIKRAVTDENVHPNKRSFAEVQKHAVSKPTLLYESAALPNTQHLGLYYPTVTTGSIYTTESNVRTGVEQTGEHVRLDVPVNMYNKQNIVQRPVCPALDSFDDGGNVTQYGKCRGVTRLKKHTGRQTKYNRQSLEDDGCDCGGC